MIGCQEAVQEGEGDQELLRQETGPGQEDQGPGGGRGRQEVTQVRGKYLLLPQKYLASNFLTC